LLIVFFIRFCQYTSNSLKKNNEAFCCFFKKKKKYIENYVMSSTFLCEYLAINTSLYSSWFLNYTKFNKSKTGENFYISFKFFPISIISAIKKTTVNFYFLPSRRTKICLDYQKRPLKLHTQAVLMLIKAMADARHKNK